MANAIQFDISAMINGEEWFWTGKTFSDNPEEQMIYMTDRTVEFIEANIWDTPMIKAIEKQGIDKKDIKVTIWGYGEIQGV